MGRQSRKNSTLFPAKAEDIRAFLGWVFCFCFPIALVLASLVLKENDSKLALAARASSERTGIKFPYTTDLRGVSGKLQAMNVAPVQDSGLPLQWHLFSWPNLWFDRFPLTIDQNLSSSRGLQSDEATYWGASVRSSAGWSWAKGTCNRNNPMTPASYKLWDLAFSNPGSHLGQLYLSDSLPDLGHPDLSGVVKVLRSDGEKQPIADAHGTHVAGVTSALRNGLGVVGVIPGLQVNVQPIAVQFTQGGPKVRGQDALLALDSLLTSLISARIAGLQTHRVVLLSWAFFESDGLDSAFIAALEQRVRRILDFDVVVVVPSGNLEGGRLRTSGKVYPAVWAGQFKDSHGSLLPVGSSDLCSQASWFSNLAANSIGTVLLAPGERIFSTLPNSDYGFMSGTSLSAAQVAAVLAMTSARFPDVEMKTQVNTLIRTAMPLPNHEGERLVSFDAPALVQGLMAEFGWIARY